MADQKDKGFNWPSTPLLSSLAYAFVTALGVFYAKAYFGYFDIDFFNYMEPLDLLLLFIQHIDDVFFVVSESIIVAAVALLLLWVLIFGSAFALAGIYFLARHALSKLVYVPWAIKRAIASIGSRVKRQSKHPIKPSTLNAPRGCGS